MNNKIETFVFSTLFFIAATFFCCIVLGATYELLLPNNSRDFIATLFSASLFASPIFGVIAANANHLRNQLRKIISYTNRNRRLVGVLLFLAFVAMWLGAATSLGYLAVIAFVFKDKNFSVESENDFNTLLAKMLTANEITANDISLFSSAFLEAKADSELLAQQTKWARFADKAQTDLLKLANASEFEQLTKQKFASEIEDNLTSLMIAIGKVLGKTKKSGTNGTRASKDWYVTDKTGNSQRIENFADWLAELCSKYTDQELAMLNGLLSKTAPSHTHKQFISTDKTVWYLSTNNNSNAKAAIAVKLNPELTIFSK